MTNNEKYIGGLIKQAREQCGLKLDELSEKVGISERYLQKIENEGNIPSYKTLKKIILALSMDSNCLFYGNEYNQKEIDDANLISRLKQCDDFEKELINTILNAFQKKKDK